MPSLNIKDYIIASLLVGMIGMWWSYSSEVETLEDDKKTLKFERNLALTSIGVHKANETTLKGSIKTQNDKITALRVSNSTKRKELGEWKTKPPKIKYKTIYETIYKEASSDCNDTKDMLDSVRTIDFNSL